jgi:hypothetical protein
MKKPSVYSVNLAWGRAHLVLDKHRTGGASDVRLYHQNMREKDALSIH